MTRLILAGQYGATLFSANRADLVVLFGFRLVWGPLPSPEELPAFLAARADEHGPGKHWSDFADWRRYSKARKDFGLIEFCRDCETVELWFDPGANDQLQLVWLLDYFRSFPEIVARLRLRVVDFDLVSASGEELDRWKVQVADVTEHELEAASATWQAYRATTPEACFDLLRRDLSALPLLRPALLELLKELPSGTTGLGATEMRMLELIASGYVGTNALFYLRSLRRTYVFEQMEMGYLLEALAHGPRPAVAGLDVTPRTPETEEQRSRVEAYIRSRLSLTEFGKSIVAHKEDFSQHNPIDRWWGGTHLTNDHLWRWNPALVKPSGRQ